MTNVTEFTRTVIKHYTSTEGTISFYESLYSKMHKKRLLDSNFVSQMSDPEKTMHRLSELVVLEHCTHCISDIESKNKGPDLTFNFESKKVNIEIITPVQVVLRKSSVQQYIYPPPKGHSANRGSIEVNIPEMSSLHERITGALKAKAEKYQTYLENGTVNKGDTNIVCINVGFIEGSEYIDYSYLKNLFKKQATIHLDISDENAVTAQIIDQDFHVSKKNNTIFKTSYFDNSEFEHVDGVWLLSCNENNLTGISKKIQPNSSDSNVIYHNYKSKISPSLLSTLKINSPQQEENFIKQIRIDNKLSES
ncbi:hypothetical protein IYR97_20020 [Pseudomonas fulva]|uniref:Uncharacterized protein n=1 Tax=Pseudomonas fulva TaxID=47880 RepID=A0A7S9LGG8_9PSED|nr:hypothetical protein [Pseudomonas fulva]QPH43550.1 hypothetical protein IYR97_20020 [Pseudomonas fulva]QPH48629.1 hypothetical protein IZU98_19985 [Pseudomonas fulva]